MTHAKILLATALVALAAAAPASATYYIDRPEAQRDMRHTLRDRGYSRVVVSCRPQWQSAPDPDYVYHRWVCGWVAGSWSRPNCVGRSLIAGSRKAGQYATSVSAGDVRGARPSA